jgi:hypothetical protein
MAVVKDLVTRDPLLEFQATAADGAPNALIPIPRPAKVSFIGSDGFPLTHRGPLSFLQPEISSTTVAENIASVKRKGLPGYTATLLCNNVACGSALIGADGLFSILSTFRKSRPCSRQSSGHSPVALGHFDWAGRPHCCHRWERYDRSTMPTAKAL